MTPDKKPPDLTDDAEWSWFEWKKGGGRCYLEIAGWRPFYYMQHGGWLHLDKQWLRKFGWDEPARKRKRRISIWLEKKGWKKPQN